MSVCVDTVEIFLLTMILTFQIPNILLHGQMLGHNCGGKTCLEAADLRRMHLMPAG